jgi:multiple sugar transport system permease protein
MQIADSVDRLAPGTTGSRRAGTAARARFVTTAVPHLLLTLLAIATVLPFLWMVLNSFKLSEEIVRQPPTFLPERWTLRTYEELFGSEMQFGLALGNSLIVAVGATASVLFFASLAGFVFAKYRFAGKEILFVAILSTLMVPFSVVLVPLFVVVTKVGLYNSIPGLLATELVSTFGIFLMRQFLETIPDEMLDAARVDGASEWWIYSRVVVPLSGQALGALAIFTFMWNWDAYLWPLVMLTSPEKMTLPLALARLQHLYYTRYDIVLTGATVTIVPVVIVYLFFQRHFVRGIALTGMKG